MKAFNLIIAVIFSSFLFASCKSDEDKRNDAIIKELNPEIIHNDGSLELQRITVYVADSLDYWAVPVIQDALNMYLMQHRDWEHYNNEAQRCSDPSLVLKAAQYGLGGDRYASERNAREGANRCMQAMTEMEPHIEEMLKTVNGIPRDGVWVIEEYSYHKPNSKGTYRDFYLYKFSDAGELISQPREIGSANPFDIINRLKGQTYTSISIK